jgi:hypothetical protein
MSAIAAGVCVLDAAALDACMQSINGIECETVTKMLHDETLLSACPKLLRCPEAALRSVRTP